MIREKQTAPLRILLGEDNEHDQIAVERAMLRSDVKFDLSVCKRAEEIEQALQNGGGVFDVVVVDYNLPGENGLEAYHRLRDSRDLPPFVMLTGAGTEDLAVEALKAGMDDYIVKDPQQGYLRLLPLKLKDVKQRFTERQERLKAKAQLAEAYRVLEETVARRTSDLSRTVEVLQVEVHEKQQSQKALQQSEKSLRNLSMKIIETQENERRRLAKELHDSIGSSLAAIKFALEERLQQMDADPPPDTIALEKIVQHTLDTITEVRRLSSNLRPSVLDDYGLIAAIESYCNNSAGMYREKRIETRFGVDEGSISQNDKIVIYRVMQEAVNNALRHSGADTIRVHIVKSSGRIQLRVEDNGCGFSPDQKIHKEDPLSGFGIQGMRERAEAASGSLVFESGERGGTVVLLEVPRRLIDADNTPPAGESRR